MSDDAYVPPQLSKVSNEPFDICSVLKDVDVTYAATTTYVKPEPPTEYQVDILIYALQMIADPWRVMEEEAKERGVPFNKKEALVAIKDPLHWRHVARQALIEYDQHRKNKS